MKCGKLIKTKRLSEARPCVQEFGHMSNHTPDLTGLKFGYYTVIERANDFIDKSGIHHTQWWVQDTFKRLVVQPSDALLKGVARGIRAKKGSGLGARLNGKKRPEYATIQHHYQSIFLAKPGTQKHKYYHGIPFYDGWNPKKNGSMLIGMKWILDNLGPRPEGAQLHLVPMNRGGKGFGPWKADDGNWSIRWLSAPENNAAHNKRWIEHCSNEEFEKEAARRGFKLVRI